MRPNRSKPEHIKIYLQFSICFPYISKSIKYTNRPEVFPLVIKYKNAIFWFSF